MHLTDIMIPTGVARSGMTVAKFFRECVGHNVPGIPYCDADKKVIGRVSIRHILEMTCIPEHVVRGAHMLGDTIAGVDIADEKILSVLELPVDDFVLDQVYSVGPTSPIVKALSLMEHYNTGCIFVLEDEAYRGIVTRMGIARLMLLRHDGGFDPQQEEYF